MLTSAEEPGQSDSDPTNSFLREFVEIGNKVIQMTSVAELNAIREENAVFAVSRANVYLGNNNMTTQQSKEGFRIY